MDLINPNQSDKPFPHSIFTHVNPLVIVPPKTGAFVVGIIDLILTVAAVICGIVLQVYIIYPAGFGNTNEFDDEFLGNEYAYTVTAMKKIYIFLVLVGILIIALSEYGLFTILRDGIRQNDKTLCGTWFEIRFVMFCVQLGGSVTYGLVMRSDTFDSEIGAAIPFFLYKLYALWIVKHCQYTLQAGDSSELKVELIDQ